MITKIYDADMNKLMKGKKIACELNYIYDDGEFVENCCDETIIYYNKFNMNFYHEIKDFPANDDSDEVVFSTLNRKEFKRYLNELIKTGTLEWENDEG